jgi:hypothetical protein
MAADSSPTAGGDARADPDRKWAVTAALVLAFVGTAGAAPPDVFAQLLYLPLLAVLSLPACVYVAAGTPASVGVRPFLAFLALAAVTGFAGAWAASVLPLGGFESALGFLVGVYAVASGVRKWVAGQRTTVP